MCEGEEEGKLRERGKVEDTNINAVITTRGREAINIANCRVCTHYIQQH